MVKKKLMELVPNKYNPRELFRGAAMEELKKSMADVGLIHPILIRPIENGKAEVVAGMRRYYAAKELKWDAIECHSRELTDLESVKIAFSENIKRENLSPIELGRMYKTFIEYLPSNGTKNKKNFPKSDLKLLEETAQEFNISAKTIGNYISLLILPKRLQNSIENDQFPKSYGFELARLPKDEIMEIYKRYYEDSDTRLSIENFKKKVSEKLKDAKLDEEKRIEQTQLKIKKKKLEIEALIKSRDKYLEKIENILETMKNQYKQKFIEESALEFLEKEIKKQSKNEEVDRIALKIKELQDQVDDLGILLQKPQQRICPYCLAKIDHPIIKKRKEIFTDEITELNGALSTFNSTKRLNEDFKKDLEEYRKFFNKKENDISLKQTELESLENELT